MPAGRMSSGRRGKRSWMGGRERVERTKWRKERKEDRAKKSKQGILLGNILLRGCRSRQTAEKELIMSRCALRRKEFNWGYGCDGGSL